MYILLYCEMCLLKLMCCSLLFYVFLYHVLYIYVYIPVLAIIYCFILHYVYVRFVPSSKFWCFLHTFWQIMVIFLVYLSFISFYAINLTQIHPPVFSFTFLWFLANVNSSSRSLYVIVRPSVVCLSSVCRLSSVVCNVGAPYSGD